MKANGESFLGWVRKRQRGQVLVLVALMLICLLGFAGLAIDVGRVYVAHRELQAATDAAAMAGAQVLPNTNWAAVATQFSAVTGGKNAYPDLPGVTMASGSPQKLCLQNPPFNYLSTSSCSALAPAQANAIQVTQQVTVPLYFIALVGTKSYTLTATSKALMKGASTPYNVAIVLDSTASMNDADGGTCNNTRINCALGGVQVLLASLSPCLGGLSSCGTNPAMDTASLFTFPAVASASPDTCGGGTISTTPYTYPVSGNPGTYQIVGFSNSYRTSDAALLNTSSSIVSAVGTTNVTGCSLPSCGTTGTTTKSGCLQAPGGQGTYYAQVIYQAEAALLAQPQTNRQNALIILSDGDATATCSAYNAQTGICNPNPGTKTVPSGGAMPGACTGHGTCTSGVYESTVNECHQAITAAKAAQTAGITVYTVAYGAEASGCTTDTPAITPCTTMEDMASSAATFFSDYTGGGGSGTCISAARPISNLDQIFQEIAGDLTVSRLIPNSSQ